MGLRHQQAPLEVFYNLKFLCETYPSYSYNTLNNYLSKKKSAYEDDDVRIERKIVHMAPVTKRKIAVIVNSVSMHKHDEEKQNLEYWLSRPVKERLEAVTRLSAQLKKSPGERLDKTIYRKITLR